MCACKAYNDVRENYINTFRERLMMTSAQIRQSFLDFFREKQHAVVPSASLMPQSPGLLFTNAGMNQFVPYFLGVWTPPWKPARATDTQKCIRAGGKRGADAGAEVWRFSRIC